MEGSRGTREACRILEVAVERGLGGQAGERLADVELVADLARQHEAVEE